MVSLYFYNQTKPINLDYSETNDPSEQQANWIEGAAIIVTVGVVVLVTAFNDYTKEKQFRGLQARIESENRVTVIRAGETIQLPSSELVVGDICHIKYGDLLPADGIIVHGNDLKVDESSLTGESDHVKKGWIDDTGGDPMLFSGTHVMEGSGRMVVTAVGVNSRAGIIFSLLGATKDDDDNGEKKNNKKNKMMKNNSETNSESISESIDDDDQDDNDHSSVEQLNKVNKKKNEKGGSVLHAKLTKLTLQISYAGAGMAILTVIILIIRYCIRKYAIEHEEFSIEFLQYLISYLIIGVTILVVAVPEGLPLAITLALAYSVKVCF